MLVTGVTVVTRLGAAELAGSRSAARHSAWLIAGMTGAVAAATRAAGGCEPGPLSVSVADLGADPDADIDADIDIAVAAEVCAWTGVGRNAMWSELKPCIANSAASSATTPSRRAPGTRRASMAITVDGALLVVRVAVIVAFPTAAVAGRCRLAGGLRCVNVRGGPFLVAPVVRGGRVVRRAAHHGEHGASAGAQEPQYQDGGQDEEGDVKPGGVVPADAVVADRLNP